MGPHEAALRLAVMGRYVMWSSARTRLLKDGGDRSADDELAIWVDEALLAPDKFAAQAGSPLPQSRLCGLRAFAHKVNLFLGIVDEVKKLFAPVLAKPDVFFSTIGQPLQ